MYTVLGFKNEDFTFTNPICTYLRGTYHGKDSPLRRPGIYIVLVTSIDYASDALKSYSVRAKVNGISATGDNVTSASSHSVSRGRFGYNP